MSVRAYRRGRRVRWLFPLFVLALATTFTLAFPDLALVLFVAVLIVYLIEPVVVRLAGLSVRGREVPRWLAVVIVYTTLLGSTVGAAAIFAPMLAREAGTLANEVPTFVRTARTDVLPRLSRAIEDLQAMFAPAASVEAPVDTASSIVLRAADTAEMEALLASTFSDDELALHRQGALQVEASAREDATPPVLFTIAPNPDGTLSVRTGDESLFVRHLDSGDYLVSTSASTEADDRRVNLEEAFSDSLNAAVETSGEEIADVLLMSQRLLGKLLSALVMILVTFMVAAFISIDVPRLVRGLEGFFPGADVDSTGRLLSRLNQGLSGVIRGQIAICLINAVLTGIGLVLLDVKFALLLAVFAGFGSLIPIFGTIISSVPALLIALTQGFGTMILLLLWILAIHFVEANVLQPKIMGTTARIHPVVIILALLAGEHAHGILGALVAVPMASVLQSLLLFGREEYSRVVTPQEPPPDVESPEPPADGTSDGEPSDATESE